MRLKTLLAFLVFLIHISTFAQKSQKVISGFIKEKGSRENLIAATVYIAETQQATLSNNYGYYSISTNRDSITLIVSSVGYQKQAFTIVLKNDVVQDFELVSNNNIAEVVVTDSKENLISQDQQMSIVRVPIEQIQQIPGLLGEKDVLKVLQLLPGVQKGSEGNSGLYVRGGGPDQNLIILDDAPVYNAFHLFGFYSLFNGDALKSVELTKGGFPARFGGRLSSVLEMNMKDGDKEKFRAEYGIGLISSRFTVQGPLKENKSSFLLSGRRTYIDALIYPLLPEESKGGYYFYDFNAKANIEIDKKNTIYLSGYFGRDKFYASSNFNDYSSRFGLYWGNGTGTIRWNRVINSKLFSNTSFIYSLYRFNISIKEKFNGDEFEIRLYSGIRDLSIKQDFDYALNNKHLIKAGVFIQQHRFTPSATTIKNSEFPEEDEESIETIDALENAAYIEDRYQITPRLNSNIGLRFSHFLQNSKNYVGLEPRLGFSYQLKTDLALKASYAIMNQYIHLLSSTGVGLPTDLWVPATDLVRPQRSNQVAIGVAKDFIPQKINISIEAYYKHMNNVIAYKDGASFLTVDEPGSEDKIKWDENVTSGQGWSYGMEFLLKHDGNRFSGWLGYTLSWTELQFDAINFGKKYFARYDRRHDLSLVVIHKVSKDITFTTTWVYGTGNAITLPKSEYIAVVPGQGQQGSYNNYVSDYGAKNGFRMEAYHRMDMGIQFHKQLKRSTRIFEISVYNLYNRKNPYFYYIGYDDSGNRKLRKINLFPMLPSISWTYKF
ncbi:MAG: TonB-dependent receptor [bacterium]|jgi:hypothetical protein